MKRRLSAILAADVVGFSRMTAQDETATLTSLGALFQDTIKPLVARYEGRVVKTLGDGFLVEFGSAVAATECAISWQEIISGIQKERPPERRLLFRIGVNLGEVVVEGTDILGDGVNVASRLEGLATPGGICLSEDIFRLVRGKVGARFEDAGEQALKNVPTPVRVFRLAAPGTPQHAVDQPRLSIRLFGGFSMEGPDGPVAIRAKKQQGLIAYLCASRTPQSRERLMDLLWGSHFDRQARQNLRQALTRLRPLVGEAALFVDDRSVGLRSGAVTSDIGMMADALSDGSLDALRAIAKFESCEFLPDLAIASEGWTEWHDTERTVQAARLVDATVRLAELELEADRYEAALDAAERALAFDPHREDGFRVLARVLAAQGRGSSIAARFGSFRRLLADELGVEPSPETLKIVETLTAPVADAAIRPGPDIPEVPSLAVIPFRNITGDERADLIRTGLAEDIVTTLAKISNMLVVARGSTEIYQDSSPDWQRVGDEQGVRYLVEGAIRMVGDRVRVTAHLREATSGREVWADRFDRWVKDFLDIQDEITKEVVSALQVQLTDGEQARVWARGTRDTRAWENVVVATGLIHEHHRDGILQARHLAEEAVELDPDYAAAIAAVGWTHWVEGRWGWEDSRERFAAAAEHARQALAIDPTNADALSLNGVGLLHLGAFDEAIAAMESAARNAPGHAHITALTGYVHRYAGDSQRVVTCMNRAIRLSPIHPVWYDAVLADGLWRTGDTAAALDALGSATRRDPDFIPALAQQAAILGELGRQREAGEVVAGLVAADPSFSARVWCDMNPHRHADNRERDFRGLIAAGAPE